jgi:hypothetical protein
MWRKISGFAKTSYQKTKAALKKPVVKAGIGFIPLGIAAYNNTQKCIRELSSFRQSIQENQQYNLDNRLSKKCEPRAASEKIEDIKAFTLAIEKKTKITGIKWRLDPHHRTCCSPADLLIVLRVTDPKILLWAARHQESSLPHLSPLLQWAALHEVGHLNSPTTRLGNISRWTMMLPCAAYLLSCIACPPARFFTLPVRLTASTIAGALAQWRWDRYEEKKADRFANNYLFEEFKSGKPESLKILKSHRDDFLSKIENDAKRITYDEHPTYAYRTNAVQHYIDLCEKHAQKQALAPQITKQRMQSLRELHDIQLD